MQVLDFPSVRPASAKLWSKPSNAPRAVRYMSGKATTVAAMTVASQEKITLMLNSCKKRPMKLLRPKMSSRKKPTTVGGSTSGKVRMPSTMPCPCGSFWI